MKYFAIIVIYCLYVTFKALQQRQVQHAEYVKMPLCSMGMAFCEVFYVSRVAINPHDFIGLCLIALCIGTGGSIGSMLGTWLHQRRRP